MGSCRRGTRAFEGVFQSSPVERARQLIVADKRACLVQLLLQFVDAARSPEPVCARRQQFMRERWALI